MGSSMRGLSVQRDPHFVCQQTVEVADALLEGIRAIMFQNRRSHRRGPHTEVTHFGAVLRVSHVYLGEVINRRYEVIDNRIIATAGDESANDFLNFSLVSRFSVLKPLGKLSAIHGGLSL